MKPHFSSKSVAVFFVVALSALSALAQSNAQSSSKSNFDANMRNANEVAKRQAAEQERQRQQEYNRNNDNANGISQRTGPTVGRTSDGKGASVGYQKSTK